MIFFPMTRVTIVFLFFFKCVLCFLVRMRLRICSQNGGVLQTRPKPPSHFQPAVTIAPFAKSPRLQTSLEQTTESLVKY